MMYVLLYAVANPSPNNYAEFPHHRKNAIVNAVVRRETRQCHRHHAPIRERLNIQQARCGLRCRGPVQAHASHLDPFETTIDTWLNEDHRHRFKQRHTARRTIYWMNLISRCQKLFSILPLCIRSDPPVLTRRTFGNLHPQRPRCQSSAGSLHPPNHLSFGC
jgi:hypothetical protein